MDDELKHALGGHCPVQGYGEVDDLCWYFRARGNGWTLDIGPDAGDGYVEHAVWEAGGRWGEFPDAGWMDYEVAAALVSEALRRYRAGQPPWDAPDHHLRPTPEALTPDEALHRTAVAASVMDLTGALEILDRQPPGDTAIADGQRTLRGAIATADRLGRTSGELLRLMIGLPERFPAPDGAANG